MLFEIIASAQSLSKIFVGRLYDLEFMLVMISILELLELFKERQVSTICQPPDARINRVRG
jgi:hypothetical protein